MRKITPIAMKCNKEQFEAIKPKLDNAGFKIRCLSDFSIINYLCNFAWVEKETISNFTTSDYKNFNREVHETWNDRIFLEACGIETEETFEITKETIIKYKMKDEFPQVFEVKLEVGKWYSISDKTCQFTTNAIIFFDNNERHFGFGYKGNWTTIFLNLKEVAERNTDNVKKATEQEVFEALKDEAVKRGFGERCLFDFEGVTYSALSGNDFTFYDFELNLQAGVVFSNGTWATIIPTKTKEEAEKLLNCKIV